MGNSVVQNGVQTSQPRRTGMVQIVTARARPRSDGIEQQMDRLNEECGEITDLECRQKNATSNAVKEFCTNRLRARQHEFHTKQEKLNTLINDYTQILRKEIQRELEEDLIVVTSAHAKLKRDMIARGVNIKQPDVSMSPLAMVRSNENRAATEPAI